MESINPRFSASIFICKNLTKKSHLELLRKGALSVLEEPISPSYLFIKMESIHRENFEKKIIYKNKYIADLKEENIKDKTEKSINLSGKSFSILAYLLKNRHRGAISKDEILNANWDEPEMVSDNVIEVNINIIRNALKNEFNDNFIETIRHKGYKIVDSA